jgi:hypothetical protein
MTADELKTAGFTDEEITKSGYTPVPSFDVSGAEAKTVSKLIQAGFGEREIAEHLQKSDKKPDKRTSLMRTVDTIQEAIPSIPSPTDAIISLIKNPRAIYQGLGAATGGTVGSGAGPGGTIAGGALGYAAGNKAADLLMGPEEDRKATAGTVSGELTSTAKDVGVGLLYELIGMGATFGGKAIGGTVDMLKAVKDAGGIKKAIEQGIESLAKKQAGKKIAEATTKTGVAVDTIQTNALKNEAVEKEISGLELNLGQKGGDPNLLSLARQKGQQPGLGTAMSNESVMTQDQVIKDYIQTHVRGGGNVDDFLASIQKEQERLTGQSAATGKGVESAASSVSGRSAEDVGGTILDLAKKGRTTSAKTAEKLYKEVPEDLKIDATPLWDKVQQIFGGFDKFTQRLSATPSNAMKRIKEGMTPEQAEPSGLLGPTGKPIQVEAVTPPQDMTMKQMKDFRSQMSTVQREAQAGGDYELAYKAGQLKDGVNDTLALAAEQGQGEGVQALKAATDYWRDVHIPTYRQGVTGRILKTDSTGAQRVVDSSIGGEYFKAGKGAIEAVDDFKRAFKDIPEAQGLINDYAAHSLLKYARNPISGELDTVRVSRWMNQHSDAIKGYGIENNFSSLKKAMSIADGARTTEVAFNKTSLAKSLNVNPDLAIQEALMTGTGRKQSIERLKEMVKLASVDKTGASLDGLKAGIGDYFQNEITITTRDLAGKKLESLAKIDRFIKNFKPALEASGLYTPRELKAFDTVHQAVSAIGQQQRPHPGYSNSTTSDLMTRAAASGTSLVLGHFGIYGTALKAYSLLERPIKEQIDNAVVKAIFDPRYADVLAGFATNVKKTGAQKAAELFTRRVATLGTIAAGNAGND